MFDERSAEGLGAVASAPGAPPPPACRFSVVIPLLDEEAAIGPLLEEIREVLARSGQSDFEIVCVDDGSGDATPRVLAREARGDPRLRVLRHRARG